MFPWKLCGEDSLSLGSKQALTSRRGGAGRYRSVKNASGGAQDWKLAEWPVYHPVSIKQLWSSCRCWSVAEVSFGWRFVSSVVWISQEFCCVGFFFFLLNRFYFLQLLMVSFYVRKDEGVAKPFCWTLVLENTGVTIWGIYKWQECPFGKLKDK